jgi:voltage-gated potassium channel Kch
LLGLFFVTTGASLDVGLLIKEWPIVVALLVGLLALKTTVISAIGPLVGLTRRESVRTGFVLSQGGEFAFVLLALANQLNVLPTNLNKLLIIVVVLSMAFTPLLTEAGQRVAELVPEEESAALDDRGNEGYNQNDPVLICGFGDVGQAVANMLEALLLPGSKSPVPYVAFDLTVPRVQAGQEAGFNVLYGDGSRPAVLHAAGVDRPRAVAVCYTARGRAVAAVRSLKDAFPEAPIFVRALDLRHAAELEEAGASKVVTAEAEAGLQVGSELARTLGIRQETVDPLANALRRDMADQSHAMAIALRKPAGGAKLPVPAQPTPQPGGQLSAVYKFDAAAAEWTPSPTMESDIEDSAASGLLAKVGATLKSLGGAENEDGKASKTNTLVTLESTRAGTQTGTMLPDGSVECPVAWDPTESKGAARVEAGGNGNGGGLR